MKFLTRFGPLLFILIISTIAIVGTAPWYLKSPVYVVVKNLEQADVTDIRLTEKSRDTFTVIKDLNTNQSTNTTTEFGDSSLLQMTANLEEKKIQSNLIEVKRSGCFIFEIKYKKIYARRAGFPESCFWWRN